MPINMASDMATPIRPLVDRILGGRLTDVLVDLRCEGLSYERIARHLGAVHGIEITGEQVRKWAIASDVNDLVAARKGGDAA